MSSRFHNKWHRHNHHTAIGVGEPDSSHDPIASPSDPFLGGFSLSGTLTVSPSYGIILGGVYQGSWPGLNTPTLQQVLTAGNNASSNNISGVNTLFANIICATQIFSISSTTFYQDILISELSGFNVTGNVNITGNVFVSNSLSADQIYVGNNSIHFNSGSTISSNNTGDIVLTPVASARSIYVARDGVLLDNNRDKSISVVDRELYYNTVTMLTWGSGGGVNIPTALFSIGKTTVNSIPIMTFADLSGSGEIIYYPSSRYFEIYSDVPDYNKKITIQNSSITATYFKVSGGGDSIKWDATHSIVMANSAAWSLIPYTTALFNGVTSVAVTHNFSRYPIVQVIDTNLSMFIPQAITHTSLSGFTVTFSTPTSGTIIARA